MPKSCKDDIIVVAVVGVAVEIVDGVVVDTPPNKGRGAHEVNSKTRQGAKGIGSPRKHGKGK